MGILNVISIIVFLRSISLQILSLSPWEFQIIDRFKKKNGEGGHPLPIYIHTSFIHIDLEHNLFLIYKIISKNMLCYKNIWNLKKKDAAVVFISKESARRLNRPILFVMVLISQTLFLCTLLWKINCFGQNYSRIRLSYFIYLLFMLTKEVSCKK